MLPGPLTALVTLVALMGAAMPQTASASVGPSPSPQTDAKRLVISVPEGGSVRSVSNNHMCSSGETCEIPIDDEFHEVFIPQHQVGYRFSSWKQSSEHFCGGQRGNCTITADTADSLSRLEPLFDRDVASTGYVGIRKLNYADIDTGFPYFATARVYADFDGDGVLDLFRAVGKWQSIERQPIEMWLGNGDGSYRRDDAMFLNPAAVGFHPRKAVVADFNGDDKADVMVADHGYDAYPWPGAPLLLYLSTADGRLEKAKGLEHVVGFHHSVAVGDVDGDGDTDAFVTAWHSAFLINDGKGNMIRDRAYLPDFPTGYTSELTDVDQDGHLDLLVAGHEFENSPSLIIWGDAEPGFADSTASQLTEVPAFGIVVDIDVADFDGDGVNDVLLNRVGSPPERDFYHGSSLQLLKGRENGRTFTDVTESSIDNDELLSYSSRPGGWFTWLSAQDWDFDGDLDIVVDDIPHGDDSEQGLVLINNGQSVFSTLRVAQP